MPFGLPDRQPDAVAVAEAYRWLGRAGLIAGSSGNVSVRTAGGMMISPTGATAERITEGVVVDMGLHEAAPRASSEWALHAALYRGRPELHAVVHTHAEACTALACLNEPLPAFHYGVLAFGGGGGAVRAVCDVRHAGAGRAGGRGDGGADRLPAGQPRHDRGRGEPWMRPWTPRSALERLCRQFLLARAAGTPRLLTEAEVEAARARFATYQGGG